MEKKTQLFFREDNKFLFRKLPLEYSCLLEKKGDLIQAGYWHTYAGQYAFLGYKNMSADTVTLGFSRDIFLDPHNKIPVSVDVNGKPAKDKVGPWIAKVATMMRQIWRSKPNQTTLGDYVNYALMGVIALMAIGWLISFTTG